MRGYRRGDKNRISIHALRVEGDVRGYRRGDKNRISIHALRGEGDLFIRIDAGIISRFLSTPSGWRATVRRCPGTASSAHFYPRPPGGGRPSRSPMNLRRRRFLSTPSGWRATNYPVITDIQVGISIHALRVEGDGISMISAESFINFYPRPPGGGRPVHCG